MRTVGAVAVILVAFVAFGAWVSYNYARANRARGPVHQPLVEAEGNESEPEAPFTPDQHPEPKPTSLLPVVKEEDPIPDREPSVELLLDILASPDPEPVHTAPASAPTKSEVAPTPISPIPWKKLAKKFEKLSEVTQDAASRGRIPELMRVPMTEFDNALTKRRLQLPPCPDDGVRPEDMPALMTDPEVERTFAAFAQAVVQHQRILPRPVVKAAEAMWKVDSRTFPF